MKKIIENRISKKGLSVLTLILFTAVTFSCQSIKPKRVETTMFRKGKVVNVYQVQKKTGERVKFAKGDPAVIIDGNVKGETLGNNGKIETVVIPLSDVELVWVKKVSAGKTILGIGAGYVALSLIGAVVLVFALASAI